MAISNNATGSRPGVCTSTTRPVSPYEGQHIYETDTDLVKVWSGSAWVEIASMLTKAPRGVIGYARSTANFGITTTLSDITGMTATFTAVANRRYRATFEGFYSVSGTSQVIFRMADASNVDEDMIFQDTVSGFQTVCFQYLFTASVGSKTLKVRASINTGTANLFGNPSDLRTFSFVVEDIGAV